jgi:hypothetical protein
MLSVTNQTFSDLWIEFCKRKVYADHWREEEVELLQEEMKQVKLFFQTCANNWLAKARTVDLVTSTTEAAIVEGLQAFTNKQAVQFRAMKAQCKHVW